MLIFIINELDFNFVLLRTHIDIYILNNNNVINIYDLDYNMRLNMVEFRKN